MLKVSLVVVAVAAVVTAMLTLSVGAQSARRIEYVRVTPYSVPHQISANSVQMRYGYRACVAATNEWTCREFQPTESSDAALRTTLATLGNEGWELVSAVNEDRNVTSPLGLMYLFKRQFQ
jgi:hypothetical protein